VAYLAPERLAGGPPSPAGDVYALGVMLRELLTGAPAFSGLAPASILRMKLTGVPLPATPAPMDAELEELTRQATARDPRRRPGTRQLLAELGRRRGGAPPAGARTVLL
jgi:serine/threonine-protein kinase